eukprot:COSAG02_NODE_9663_length_2148_cov_3.258122_4_plen_42_part_00
MDLHVGSALSLNLYADLAVVAMILRQKSVDTYTYLLAGCTR